MATTVKISSQSAAQTDQIARQIARHLRAGAVLALSGELGSGKTTFLKSLAAALGVRTKIKSPTFTISNVHPISKKHLTFYHFDLYRLKNPRELSEIGLPEAIDAKNHIIAIEWPNLAKKFLPKHTIYLDFSHGPSANIRTITLH